MKLTRDDFDSTIFEQDVYRLSIDAHSDLKEVITNVTSIKNGIIFGFTKVDYDCILTFEKLGFHLINIRSTYCLSSARLVDQNLSSEFKVVKHTNESIDEKDIALLAKVILQETRYGKDSAIPLEISSKVYVNWIKNSLYKGFSSGSFIVVHGNRLIGICTTKIKEDLSEIDLLCVLPDYRGKGIGKALIKAAVAFLSNKQDKPIYVVTSGENIPANSLFQKNGFVIHNVELVYHKHLS